MEKWIDDLEIRMLSEDVAQDDAAVEAQKLAHRQIKSEIDGHAQAFDTFDNFGSKLLADFHYSSDTITDKMETLQGKRARLLDAWEARQQELLHANDALAYFRELDSAESWMAALESHTKATHTGDSLDEVEALLAQQDALEKSMLAQEKMLASLSRKTEVSRTNVWMISKAPPHNMSHLGSLVDRPSPSRA